MSPPQGGIPPGKMCAGLLSSWPEHGSDLLREMREQLVRGLTQIILIPRIMHISPSVVAFQSEFCLLLPSNVQLLIPNEVCDCLRH